MSIQRVGRRTKCQVRDHRRRGGTGAAERNRTCHYADRACRLDPKTKCDTKSFRQHFRSARGGFERLRALLFAKKPAVSAWEK